MADPLWLLQDGDIDYSTYGVFLSTESAQGHAEEASPNHPGGVYTPLVWTACSEGPYAFHSDDGWLIRQITVGLPLDGTDLHPCEEDDG